MHTKTEVNRSVVVGRSAMRDQVQSQPSLSANGDDIDFSVDVKDLSDLNVKTKTTKRAIDGKSRLILNAADGKRAPVEKP